MRRDFPEVVSAVRLHGGPVVQAGELLVRIHRRQDGADVRLRVRERMTGVRNINMRGNIRDWTS